MDSDEQKFRSDVLQIAALIKLDTTWRHSFVAPKDIHADLCVIDKVLSTALQALIPMELAHVEGQDLQTESFNWQLVRELRAARMTAEMMRVKGLPDKGFHRPTYPTQVLADLVELRDAARMAAHSTKPKRGNSSRRTARNSQLHELSWNFVFRFRSYFGFMPPVSKTGWIVDLMQEALDTAGLSGADASEVLRAAIEKDPMRQELSSPSKRPPASEYLSPR